MTLAQESASTIVSFDSLVDAGLHTLKLESLHNSNLVHTDMITVTVVEYYRDPSESVASQIKFVSDAPPTLLI